MANYTLDGAKIDVGTRKFVGDKGISLTGTTYVRVVGAGNYGKNDFLPVLELIEIVRPYSDFLPSDSEGRAKGKKSITRNMETVLESRVLTSKPSSVDACRKLCDEVFNLGFLKSEQGQELVRDWIGQKKEFATAYRGYLDFVKPPQNKLIALIDTLDNKTLMIRDEESGMLKLPTAVRCDRAEPLSVGFNNSFLECQTSVKSLRLRTYREHDEFTVNGLRDVFRAVSGFAEVSSELLSSIDPDVAGVTIPRNESAWDISLERRVAPESLQIVKAFREKKRVQSEEGALEPQI